MVNHNNNNTNDDSAMSATASAASSTCSTSRRESFNLSGGVERPLLDQREYRSVTLSCGVRALLVSDPTTDKSAAAMDVRAGQLSDPRDMQGLAHYLEHMLFLGTERFPDENEYSSFLNQHGGYSNAYTAHEHTNYYFQVAHEHMRPALDRFASFFCGALFTESCAEREVNAVDSEHSKNRLEDGWRLYQLGRTLSNPDHPISQFGTGSRATLWEEPLAAESSAGKRMRSERCHCRAAWTWWLFVFSLGSAA